MDKPSVSKDFQLIEIENRLSLYRGQIDPDKKPNKSNYIYVDFCSNEWAHRLNAPGREMLSQAVGVKKSYSEILDLTCGLGQDSYLLASLGLNVVSVERSEKLYKLVQDALNRLEEAPSGFSFQLHHADSAKFLESYNKPVDVIYIDPMFPEKKKSSLPSKEMQFLQELLGEDTTGEDILEVALKKKCSRVVVKRPLKAGFLNDKEPGFQIKGKTIRYDIY